MTDGTGDNQNYPAGTMQRAAALLRRNEHDILNLWIDAVYKQVPAAEGFGRVEVGDHLRNLLLRIVDTLVSADSDIRQLDASAAMLSLPSAMHGRERATLKGYTVGQVVHEYSVLRRVLTDFCRDHGLYDTLVLDVITSVIEFCSLNSVNEFVEAVQETQRKLVSTLIHDVRTPLGTASNYLELLSRKEVSEEQKKRAVKTARRNLSRVITMLEDLLDSARPIAGRGLLMRFQEADINEEIHTICIEASNIYDRVIRFSLEDHPVIGVFDVAQIIRTMENLISNAVKFGDEKESIQISVIDEGDRVAIRVHNRGGSIPAEEFGSIFSFFSGSNDKGKKGWGLGLALIKTIAAGHGGEVIFESSDTTGTTFGMKLLKHFRRVGEEESVVF